MFNGRNSQKIGAKSTSGAIDRLAKSAYPPAFFSGHFSEELGGKFFVFSGEEESVNGEFKYGPKIKSKIKSEDFCG